MGLPALSIHDHIVCEKEGEREKEREEEREMGPSRAANPLNNVFIAPHISF